MLVTYLLSTTYVRTYDNAWKTRVNKALMQKTNFLNSKHEMERKQNKKAHEGIQNTMCEYKKPD